MTYQSYFIENHLEILTESILWWQFDSKIRVTDESVAENHINKYKIVMRIL